MTSLGPALYRAIDGTDLACIVTMVEPDGGCCLTVFAPGAGPQFYTRIKFDKQARANTVKPGTVYRE